VLGTAGSGKTLLTRTLKEWFDARNLDVLTLNLDPGVKRLPYNPDIDARDYIDINEVIDAHNLGPNGAMIASMDLLAGKIKDIRDEIEYLGPEYLLVDTPGQMELFAYRTSGRLISSVIAEESQSTSVFLIDPFLALTPEGFASVLLLSVSVAFQLLIGQIVAISKDDLIEEEQKKLLNKWFDSPETLITDIYNKEKLSMTQQLGLSIIELLEKFKVTGDLFSISSHTGYNIDTLVGMIERHWGVKDDFYE